MKKITLLLVAMLGMTSVYSQTTVGAPANTNSTTTLRAPNGTAAHTTLRGHIIVTAAELAAIPSGTVINGLGFLYNSGVNTAVTGNIQYYMENTSDATNLKSTTWSTAISTMTSVYNGAYTIPTVAGVTNSTLSTPFTYTGGGLYVAYDYLGTSFATTAAVYLCNTTIAGGVKVEPSATTTPPAVLLGSSGFRPEMQFTFPNPFTNNLAVNGLFAGKGQDNLLFGTTQNVQAQVKNLSSGALTNVPVFLNITGANPYTGTQTIASIAPGATTLVNFTGVPKTNAGTQTVVVNVPPDQQTINDTYTLTQDVFCDTVGYAYGDTVTGGLGYDTGTGILANLFAMPSGSPIHVTKVVPTISDAPAVANKTIVGVLLNSSGVIIDSTASHVITTAELGQEVELTFINGAIDHAGDSVYIGFRQVANVAGYFPCATQEITGITPVDLFCGFGAFGGAYANYTTFGAFMIAAVVSPVNVLSNIANNVVCPNTSATVTATSGMTSYDFILNGTSMQSGATSSYTFTQTANTNVVVNATIGGCSFADSLIAIQGATSSSNVSATFCPGTTYMFNGQSLTSPGNYTATISNAQGCDSTIALTLAFGATSGTNNQMICAGSSYSIGTSTYSTAGTYFDTLQTAAGCDSIVTTNLTFFQPLTSSVQASICAGESYMFGGQSYSTSGSYADTVQNAAGCDSIVTLTLTVDAPLNLTVTNSGSVLTSAATGGTYQWIECSTNAAIAGATSATFQPTALVGTYAVVITSGNCSDTSACFSVDQTGINELELSATVRLYPNPSVDLIHLVSEDAKINSYKVFDMSGRLVLSSSIDGGNEAIEISVDKLESGSYTIELSTSKGRIGKTFLRK